MIPDVTNRISDVSPLSDLALGSAILLPEGNVVLASGGVETTTNLLSFDIATKVWSFHSQSLPSAHSGVMIKGMEYV